MGFFDGLSNASNGAPAAQPSTIVAAAGQADPNQAAQIFQQALTVQAQAQAQDENAPTHSGFFSSVLGAVKAAANYSGVSGLLNYANKPLQEVQRDYRFLHEVYAKHGFFAGLEATAPIVGGGAIGSLLPGAGTVLGAEIGAMGSRAILGNTQFQDANAAIKNDHVSVGRDIAKGLGNVPGLGALGNTNKGVGRLLSGSTDGAFDLVGDPLMAVGSLNRARKVGSLAEKAVVKTPASTAFLQKIAPGLAIKDAASIDTAVKAYSGVKGGVGSALDDIAASSAAEIIKKYPALSALAAPLGAATSRQSVIDVFKSAAENKPIGDVSARLQAADSFLADHGTRLNSTPDVEVVFKTHPAARATAEDIAGLNTQEIADRYPQYAPLGTELGKAKTADDVQDVFRQAAMNAEIARRINEPGFMPSKSLMRVKASNLQQRLMATGETFDPETGASELNRAGRVIKSFTQMVPFSIDQRTQELSTQVFDPNGADAGKVVHDVAAFGMGNETAKYWANKFVQAGNNTGLKKNIYGQVIMEAAKGFGLTDDTEVVRNLYNDIQGSVHGAFDTEAGGKYMHGWANGDKGNSVTVVDPENGEKVFTAPMGLWENQRGHLPIPDFREWVTAKREIQTSRGIMGGAQSARGFAGRVDDWVYKHYTAGFFKPLALANAGFGQRIALAELIPQVSRYGFLPTFKAMLTSKAAEHGVKLLDKTAEGEEAGHIFQGVSSALGGMTKALKAKPDELEFATDMALDHDTGTVAHGISRTGHNLGGMSNIEVEKATAGQRALIASENAFELLGVGNARYTDQWGIGLSKLAVERPAQRIAQDLLKLSPEEWRSVVEDKILPHGVVSNARDWIIGAAEMDPMERSKWLREQGTLGRYSAQEANEFGAARVDDVLGKTIGADGTVHKHLLEKIAKGEKPEISDAEAIAAESRPAVVPGRTDGDSIQMTSRPLAKLIDMGFKKLVDPIINNLSRNPLYYNAAKRHYDALTVGDNSALARGIIPDKTTARMLAYQRATVDILPQIHNTALRSQFSVLASNIMPFYFAQEQAWKRAANAIAYNPALIREYQLINAGMTNNAFVHTDDQGNKSIVLPGVGELGEGALKAMSAMGIPVVSGLPLTFTGDLSSLKTVFPTAAVPGASPIIGIGAHYIGQWFPETQPAFTAVLGDAAASQPLINQLMPNVAIRETYRATLGAHYDDSEIYSQAASAMAAAAYHDELPPPDATAQEKEAFLARIKNNARSALFMKGIVSLFSPLSNRPIEEDFGLRDEFYKILKGNGGDYQAALLKFQGEHGSKAISYTVAHSKSDSGAAIPTSQAAIDFLNQHQGLLGKYNLAAPYLVPQETKGGDAYLLHNELLTMGLRSQFTPQDLLDQFYITSGDQQYFKNYDSYLAQLANATGNGKFAQAISEGNTAGLDTAALEKQAQQTQQGARIVAGWNEWSKSYNLAHPTWSEDFTSNDRTSRAVNVVQQLFQMSQSHELPQNSQTQSVLTLASAYSNMLAMLNSTPGQTNRATAARKEITAQWQQFLAQQVAATPGLQNVVTQVFKRLPTDMNTFQYMVSASSQPGISA